MSYIKVAACQVPEIREDREAAIDLIAHYGRLASSQGAQLVCFPECFLQGYLTEEPLARRHAVDLESPAFRAILAKLADVNPVLVFGLIEIDEGTLYNAAVVVRDGELVGRYRKSNLLEGERLFRRGESWPVFDVGGITFGINVCSDTAVPGPAAAVTARGARLIVCPANNMMRRRSAEEWKHRHNEIRGARARENGVWLLSADVTGERGNRIALGPTAVIDPAGKVVVQVPLSEPGMAVAEIGPF